MRTTTTNRNTGTAKLEIVYRDIDSITPYKNNPRKNDEAAEELAEDIKKYDFNQPITIDADSIIVSGHTRYKAAKALGIKEVPTITLSHLTPRQIREYRIRDNKVGERADWDYEILTIECQEMGIDPADLGFDFDPGDIIDTTEVTEDDYEEPDELPPTVKLGEIWRCGDHILLCGDATDEATVRRLVQEGGGMTADMVFTDPPYNVSLGTKNRALNAVTGSHSIERPILGDGDDGQSDEEVGRTLWLPAFRNLFANAKDKCSIYVTMPQGGTHMMMMMMIHEAGWQVKHELMWKKNVPTFSMNRLDYDYQHEPIMYGWKKTHKWIGKGEHQKSVWEIDKLPKCDLHPTMKPLALIINALLNSSEKGDTILDVFGGSGSTMMACEQTGRRCLMMELDPHYCDVIIDRWQRLTGKEAVKIE